MKDESTTAVNAAPDSGAGVDSILSGDVMAQGRNSEMAFQHSNITTPILAMEVATMLNFPVWQFRQ